MMKIRLAVLTLFVIIEKSHSQSCNDTPGVMGPCRAFLKKWTYSGGSCTQFTYGGSSNRFDSLSQCQAVCGGSGGGSRLNEGSSFGGSSFVSSSCNQPPFEYGRCGNNFQRWSYIWQTGSCQPYIYSGCGGSANRFNSQNECIRNCLV